MDGAVFRAWVLRQWPVYFGAVVLSLLGFIGAFDHLPLIWLAAPLLISALIYGLPHGAIDDSILMKSMKRPGSAFWRWAIVWSAYLLVALLYLGVWVLSPSAAFVFFIILTWVHWGQGDLYFLKQVYRVSYLEHPIPKALAFFIRGGLPMGITLIAFPETYQEVAGWTLAVFGSSEQSLDLFFGTNFINVIKYTLITIILTYALLILTLTKSSKKCDALVDICEILVLSLFFLSLPPLFSIGIYFCVWHGLRHILRLWLWETGKYASKSRFVFVPGSILLKTIPNTVLSLLFLVFIFYIPQNQELRTEFIIGVYLVLIACLTLPHFFTVCYMDWCEYRNKSLE